MTKRQWLLPLLGIPVLTLLTWGWYEGREFGFFGANSAQANGQSAADSSASPGKVVVTQKPVLAPKAEIPEPEYNFGEMDPYTVGQHIFKIRNTGSAPLTLRKGPTSCKCTRFEIADKTIAPGEEGEVIVEWRTVGRQERYSHGGKLFTNAPDQEVLELRIMGHVITHLGAEPDEIVFSGVDPTKSVTGQTIVYSQAWNDFELQDFEPSIPGMTWQVGPADAQAVKSLKGLAAKAVTVTLPNDLPAGEFNHWLKFSVVSPNAKPQRYQIDVTGKVLSRLAVYGKEVDAQGVLHLGTIPQGVSKKIKLIMKVRDRDLDLNVTGIEANPGFVTARVTPNENKSNKKLGLYNLEVEIPATAPPAVHLGLERRGNLRLVIDHPRIKELNLKLDFVVEPSMLKQR